MENSQLLEYIGKTKTRNLKDEIQKEYHELIKKQYPNDEKFVRTNALISVTDLDETEIKSIGMSCLNDLFVNNWGLYLQFLLGGQGGFTGLIRQISNVGQNVRFTNSSSRMFNSTDDSLRDQGTVLFLGSGTNPPQLDNFSVQTALTSGSPENTTNGTGTSNYNFGLGKVVIPTLISPTNGAGTIRESTLFGKWFQGGTNTIQTFLITRDLISPNVDYVAVQSIDIEYSILI